MLNENAAVHNSGIISVGVYCAMNVPNLGPYARYWLRCSCTELMPCSSKEPQDTDQVYAAHIHDRNEVDDGDLPLLHRLRLSEDEWETDFENLQIDELKGIHVARWRRSVEFLAQKAHAAEIKFTLMAQGQNQPKPKELGSFTRTMSQVLASAENLFYTETVKLPLTEIMVHFKTLAQVPGGGRCCRKFLSGFHAIQLPVTPNTVANEGFLGGQLNGHSVMDFGELALEQSSGFTAMVYLKPHVADGVDEDQAILVTKGVAGSLWQLSLTSLKQFKIESFKAVPDEALPPSCTCPSVHEDEWAHVIVRDNGTAMELLVELWNSVLTDPELDQLLQRYRKARPMWHPPQQQLCPGDSIEVLEDIGSLAFCKLRCEKNPSCRSVLFKSLEKSCSLRPRVTSKDRCRLSIGSLVANLDRGQCASGAFEWQLALTEPRTEMEGVVTSGLLIN
eukprot:g27406.t1